MIIGKLFHVVEERSRLVEHAERNEWSYANGELVEKNDGKNKK